MRRILWTLWGRVRPWVDRIPPHVNVATDLDWLSRRWEARFPDVPPIGHRIRGSERWVRFHSLPESKRYAETEAEYAEVLRRHHAVLTTLAEPGSELLVITSSWSPTTYVRNRPRALSAAAPDAQLWKSFVAEPEDEDAWYTNLFVSHLENSPHALDALLRLVADYGTADVILTTSDLDWLYHPYDGGGDVTAPSREVRDALADQFAEWLPSNPAGL